MNIHIQKLYTGYLVIEETEEPEDIRKHAAENSENVLQIIKPMLGISEPEHDQEWTIEPVQITEPEKIKETLHPVPNILKQDILIPRFKYNDSLKNSILDYKNTWYAELPDGRVVLGYGGSSYYTTKENVMKIPYPVPYGYFKGSGISTTALTCLRAYRQTFAKSLIKNEDDGFSPGFSQKADDDGGGSDQALRKSLDYVSKSTQDRIKEATEQKETHRRKMDDCKGQTEMSEKTRKLRDMTIRMGIQ